MLMNLRGEMARKGIKGKDLADLLDVRLPTIYDKMNGKYAFTFDEALKVKNHFFPEVDLEYLFQNEKQIKRYESEVM